MSYFQPYDSLLMVVTPYILKSMYLRWNVTINGFMVSWLTVTQCNGIDQIGTLVLYITIQFEIQLQKKTCPAIFYVKRWHYHIKSTYQLQINLMSFLVMSGFVIWSNCNVNNYDVIPNLKLNCLKWFKSYKHCKLRCV